MLGKCEAVLISYHASKMEHTNHRLTALSGRKVAEVSANLCWGDIKWDAAHHVWIKKEKEAGPSSRFTNINILRVAWLPKTNWKSSWWGGKRREKKRAKDKHFGNKQRQVLKLALQEAAGWHAICVALANIDGLIAVSLQQVSVNRTQLRTCPTPQQWWRRGSESKNSQLGRPQTKRKRPQTFLPNVVK